MCALEFGTSTLHVAKWRIWHVKEHSSAHKLQCVGYCTRETLHATLHDLSCQCCIACPGPSTTCVRHAASPFSVTFRPVAVFAAAPLLNRTAAMCTACSDLFNKHQRTMVVTSDIGLAIMYSILAYAMFAFGGGVVARLYWAPWLVYIVWLDTVTYLHHHGVPEGSDKMPWYRYAWAQNGNTLVEHCGFDRADRGGSISYNTASATL